LRLSSILPVRGTESAMLGVMNLRGQIVPVLDLATKLGFPTSPTTDASRIIVLEESGETLGLQVDTVADVTNVSDAKIERIGGTPSLVAAEVVRGVARRDGSIIIMLDASRLLA
jgi:purine-binding chemotaxis protein CheW